MNLNCPHFTTCSGCSISTNLDLPPIAREAVSFFETIGPISLPIIFLQPYEWRTRAKVAVRGTIENPQIGLFQRNSHEVSPIPHCRVHHPLINQAIEKTLLLIKKHKIAPYCEKTGHGLLRYMQFFVSLQDNTLQTSFVINSDSLSIVSKVPLKMFLEEFWAALGEEIDHSIWVNCNTRRDNVIFGQIWQKIAGNDYLWEQFGGEKFCFQPMVFSQANVKGFEQLLQDLAQELPKQKKIVELYAGIGIIGMFLAKEAERVVCCEVNPGAKALFRKNLQTRTSAIQNKVSFYTGSVNEHIDLLEQGEVLIVDPPRKGLDTPIIEYLCHTENRLEIILYISCGWKSFQRDCSTLLAHGWKIKNAKGYILFPGTDHIETVACFEKQKI